jgi:hypothetical protein
MLKRNIKVSAGKITRELQRGKDGHSKEYPLECLRLLVTPSRPVQFVIWIESLDEIKENCRRFEDGEIRAIRAMVNDRRNTAVRVNLVV